MMGEVAHPEEMRVSLLRGAAVSTLISLLYAGWAWIDLRAAMTLTGALLIAWFGLCLYHTVGGLRRGYDRMGARQEKQQQFGFYAGGTVSVLVLQGLYQLMPKLWH